MFELNVYLSMFMFVVIITLLLNDNRFNPLNIYKFNTTKKSVDYYLGVYIGDAIVSRWLPTPKTVLLIVTF